MSLLWAGCSRRAAARWVGCSPSTITRTAEREPGFAEELARAEQAAEIEAVRLIRKAASNERYWRAAAWLLERKNREDFGTRAPGLFTGQQVAGMIAEAAKYLGEEIPEENRQRALAKLDELIGEFRVIDPPLDPPRTTDQAEEVKPAE